LKPAVKTEVEIEPAASATTKPIEIWVRVFWIASLASFLLCLPLSAFVVRGETSYLGFKVLVSGPMALLVAFKTHWPWLANPALTAAWLALYFRAAAAAAIFAGAAVLSAAYFWAFPGIMDNEGSVVVLVSSLGPGYWFWLASTLCALAAALIQLNMAAPVSRQPD
jgi:hypothetical protein